MKVKVVKRVTNTLFPSNRYHDREIFVISDDMNDFIRSTDKSANNTMYAFLDDICDLDFLNNIKFMYNNIFYSGYVDERYDQTFFDNLNEDIIVYFNEEDGIVFFEEFDSSGMINPKKDEYFRCEIIRANDLPKFDVNISDFVVIKNDGYKYIGKLINRICYNHGASYNISKILKMNKYKPVILRFHHNNYRHTSRYHHVFNIAVTYADRYHFGYKLFPDEYIDNEISIDDEAEFSYIDIDYAKREQKKSY